MDANDLFRKLTCGAKFNFKKYSSDAQKLKGLKQTYIPVSPTINIKREPNEDFYQLEDDTVISEVNEANYSDNELTLLGSIKAANTGRKVEKRKKTQTKEVLKNKQAAQQEEQIFRLRKQHRISVVGRNVPPPIESFKKIQDEFSLAPALVQNFQASGYTHPTPIQMQAIPIMLQGRQILACAPTGSGKTAAFLIPVIHHLAGPRKLGFRAVIVSPTRELASQTYRECVRLSEGTGLRSHIISKTSQAVNKFGPHSSKKFDILVTTPNRLVYLLQQDPPVLSLNNVEWLIVDESDKLLRQARKVSVTS